MTTVPDAAPARIPVPRFVGTDILRALNLAVLSRLTLRGPADAVPLSLSGTVVAQQPEPGTVTDEGDDVTVWM